MLADNTVGILEFLGMKECDQWELFYADGELLGEVHGIDAVGGVVGGSVKPLPWCTG